MKLPTVKVKHRDGFIIMNESDFDESKHELFIEEPEKPAPNSEEPEKPAPKKRGPKPKAKQEEAAE